MLFILTLVLLIVICHWDLSYFKAALGNLNLNSLVRLNEVTLEVDARDEFALSFKTSVTVFFLLGEVKSTVLGRFMSFLF